MNLFGWMKPEKPNGKQMAQELRNRKVKLEATQPGNIFSKRRSFGEDVVEKAVRGR